MPPKRKKPAAKLAAPKAAPRLGERLRRSEARLRAVLDAVPDLLLELDREGTVRYANRARPGYEPEDLTGRAVTDLVLPHERETVRLALAQAWESGERVDLEFSAADPEGRVT